MKDSEKANFIENKRLERQKQDTTGRLIELLTGISANDPSLLERLDEDKKIVRNKYNLPPEEMLSQNLREYYDLLMQEAEKNNLKIRPKEYDAKFFEENEEAVAKFEKDTMTIVFDLNEETERKYRISLRDFEHELIHGLQLLKYPNMPIEVMEYEAYVAGPSIELMKKSSKSLWPSIFRSGLVGSVMNWYERNERVPEWNNPEYFLKNIDKVEVFEDEFVDLDNIDRSGFVWNRVSDGFDQILNYLIQIDRNSGDEEKLKRRLLFDRKNTREKYGLPVWVGEYNEDYLTNLKNKCVEYGITLNNEDDYRKKYGEELKSSGFCDENDPLIFINYEIMKGEGVKTLIKAIEHEYIHARQVLSGKIVSHTPEQNEYEALVGANLNVFRLEDNFDSAMDYIAGGMIGSVDRRYKRKGIKPPWRLH